MLRNVTPSMVHTSWDEFLPSCDAGAAPLPLGLPADAQGEVRVVVRHHVDVGPPDAVLG